MKIKPDMLFFCDKVSLFLKKCITFAELTGIGTNEFMTENNQL